MRPKQWIKNIFVFIPIFFAGVIGNGAKVSDAFIALIIFSLTASGIYIINDWFDRQHDAQHPTKKYRPLAAGTVRPAVALVMVVVLFALASTLISWLMPALWWVMITYVCLGVAYSRWLKHQPIFDIVVVVCFYLLRVIAGGVATATPISNWLVLCVVFLSCFLVVGKRFAEFNTGGASREVLQLYSAEFLSHLLTITISLTILSYSLYTILGTTSPWAVYSIFFVLIGMWRYLLLLHTKGTGEYPEKLVFSDPVVTGSVLGWGGFLAVVFYWLS